MPTGAIGGAWSKAHHGECLVAAVAFVIATTAGPAPAQTCQQLSGVFSAILLGSTSGESAESGSCGGADAPEAVFFYSAPRAGDYTIDTIGSGFDTVLYVRDNQGTELICNDDDPLLGGQISRVRLTLAQGQMVTIFVDGSGTQSGSFTLRINGNCPQTFDNDPRDLGNPLSVSVSGNTGCGNFLAGGSMCAGDGTNAPDATFLYSVPSTGRYTFDTIGSSFDTLLSIRGGTCTGLERGCNDDIDMANQQSLVTLELESAELLLIAVDGYGMASGSFTLNIAGTPFTPTATRTPTNTRTASRTPTITPTRTQTPTRMPTTTRSPTHTLTPTRTRTPTRSPTASRSATPSGTPTATTGPPTSTSSPTVTASAPAIVTSTPTPTETGTRSPTRSATLTRTSTTTALVASATPTRTAPAKTATGTPTTPRTHTPSTTPLRTASATSAPNTPVPTSTPSASPVATASPTMAAGPISYCVARGAGFLCRIDFERLPDGRVPDPEEVISDQFQAATGISFPDGGAAIRPLAGTSSPDLALRNAIDASQEETNPGPLHLVFDDLRVTRLSLRVGLDQPVSGVRPILTVFDAAGAASQVVTGAVLPDGPTAVEEPIEITPSGFFISRAALLYDGTTAAARNAVEVIDDLEIEIEGRPPCPPHPDSKVPLVVFTPADDVSESRALPRLDGTIGETSGMLLHVTAEVAGPAGSYVIDLSPYVLQNSGAPGLFTFSVDDLELFSGANRITVRAEDGGCPSNHNESLFDIDQIGPDPDFNVYAMALEITQSIQDQLQVREVAREGSDPTVFAPIPYAGVPLVANKRTVVRAYAEVQSTLRPGAAVHGVPAQLIMRRDGSETDLVAAGITIDPTDQVNLPGGMRDLGRTLANKRGAITKSWNFVLPDSLTAPGTIDELELRVNPPELSGPSECAGCDDAANRLRVSTIPFTQLATMSMRAFYLAQDAEVGMMPGADSRTFCGPLARMFPLADGCGTGPINRNDFGFGINLLSLTRLDPKVNNLVGMDGRSVNAGVAQGRMCESMYWDGLHTIPGFTPPADYFGIVPAGVPFDGPFSGVGGPNHPRYFPSACSSGGEGNWPVAAQEIGHGILVRDAAGMDIAACAWHAPCGSPACPLATFPLYPDPSGSTYPSASIGHFGLDTQTLTVFDPQTTFDFMSYCSPVWTSSFSYRIMFAHFRDSLEPLWTRRGRRRRWSRGGFRERISGDVRGPGR